MSKTTWAGAVVAGALIVGSASTAAARTYYYNPSYPSQPGSFLHHQAVQVRQALYSVGSTSVRMPNGPTYIGSPSSGVRNSGLAAPPQLCPPAASRFVAPAWMLRK